MSLFTVFNSMSTQNKEGQDEYLLQDQIATLAGRRESRVVAGSKYIRTKFIINNYNTTIILPVSPWRTAPTMICRHINVTRFLVNNHASARELVVYKRGEGPEITTHSNS